MQAWKSLGAPETQKRLKLVGKQVRAKVQRGGCTQTSIVCGIGCGACGVPVHEWGGPVRLALNLPPTPLLLPDRPARLFSCGPCVAWRGRWPSLRTCTRTSTRCSSCSSSRGAPPTPAASPQRWSTSRGGEGARVEQGELQRERGRGGGFAWRRATRDHRNNLT